MVTLSSRAKEAAEEARKAAASAKSSADTAKEKALAALATAKDNKEAADKTLQEAQNKGPAQKAVDEATTNLAFAEQVNEAAKTAATLAKKAQEVATTIVEEAGRDADGIARIRVAENNSKNALTEIGEAKRKAESAKLSWWFFQGDEVKYTRVALKDAAEAAGKAEAAAKVLAVDRGNLEGSGGTSIALIAAAGGALAAFIAATAALATDLTDNARYAAGVGWAVMSFCFGYSIYYGGRGMQETRKNVSQGRIFDPNYDGKWYDWQAKFALLGMVVAVGLTSYLVLGGMEEQKHRPLELANKIDLIPQMMRNIGVLDRTSTNTQNHAIAIQATTGRTEATLDSLSASIGQLKALIEELQAFDGDLKRAADRTSETVSAKFGELRSDIDALRQLIAESEGEPRPVSPAVRPSGEGDGGPGLP